MATRMQQRRGTAAQWTAANPVLAAGEIGFETDTNKFKVGNGSTAWSSLTYFVDASIAFDSQEVTDAINAAIANVIDAAPEALNTLNELAAALGDDANFATSTLNSLSDLGNNISLLNTDLSNLTSYVQQTFASRETDFNNHLNDTLSVHGISNTEALAFKSDVTSEISNAVSTHSSDSTNVHGILDTADLATKEYADSAVSTHTAVTTNVHGIADTSVLATDSDVSTAISDHSAVTTNVHGIADTSLLATQSYASEAASNAQAAAESHTDSHVNSTTNVHGIADMAQVALLNANAQTFTGSMEIDGNLVVDGNFTVNGGNVLVSATQLQVEDSILQLAHENASNTVDLGLVVSYNDGTQKHAGLVKDTSDSKWKLFKDVTDEPSTTVNFSQGGLDDLAVAALSATTVTPSSGVVFSDGTQTKEGVPSRTTIISKTSSYTLSALDERDEMIEMNSASALTLTIPLNSSVAYPVGTSIDILQVGAGQVTIAGASGVTVNGTPGLKLRTQWSSATLFKRATDSWVVMGDLTA